VRKKIRQYVLVVCRTFNPVSEKVRNCCVVNGRIRETAGGINLANFVSRFWRLGDFVGQASPLGTLWSGERSRLLAKRAVGTK